MMHDDRSVRIGARGRGAQPSASNGSSSMPRAGRCERVAPDRPPLAREVVLAVGVRKIGSTPFRSSFGRRPNDGPEPNRGRGSRTVIWKIRAPEEPRGEHDIDDGRHRLRARPSSDDPSLASCGCFASGYAPTTSMHRSHRDGIDFSGRSSGATVAPGMWAGPA
jgi:hypothetical protein